MHKTSAGTLCKNWNNSGAINCNGGVWTNPTAKIGLMYASDYTLSLGARALAITGDTYDNRATIRIGWMHPSKNDTTKNTLEWTLSRLGARSSDFGAWYVYSDGDVRYGDLSILNAVRPVFYLTTDVKITTDGDGSLNNPFILK